MDNLIQALDGCVKSENWYGALFIALTLPDICGKIDQPDSQHHYAAWFDRYVKSKYVHGDWTFLTGNDCYALRCAFLHEGKDNISTQNAKETVEKFYFRAPGRGTMHCNKFNNTLLQLQVDIFCNDIKEGVLSWLKNISGDVTKKKATECLLKIGVGDIEIKLAETGDVP